MSIQKTYHELLINFFSPLINSLYFLQTSYKLLTNFLQASYKLLTSFLRTSYKLLTNFL